MSVYILISKDKRAVFYYNKGNIFKKEYSENKWSESQIIGEKVRESFVLTKEAIVYQNLRGDIISNKGRGGKIILASAAPKAPDINIYTIFYKDSMTLLYNIVKNNQNKFVTQYKHKNFPWKEPVIHDNIEINKNIFTPVAIGDNHIVFYTRKAPEYQFGYREITENSIGPFKTVFSSGYKITDFSYYINENSLNFLFVQKRGLTDRLVYVKKDINGVSQPFVIGEYMNIKSCLVTSEDCSVKLWWISSNCLCSTYIDNFRKIQYYRNINTNNIKKATVLNFDNQNICNEAYLTIDNNLEFISEL